MTREELELKAKEFDSKLKRHPMSSEELQKVLCDFVEALRIHDVVVQSEQLCPDCGSTGRRLPQTLDSPDGLECECGAGA